MRLPVPFLPAFWHPRTLLLVLALAPVHPLGASGHGTTPDLSADPSSPVSGGGAGEPRAAGGAGARRRRHEQILLPRRELTPISDFDEPLKAVGVAPEYETHPWWSVRGDEEVGQIDRLDLALHPGDVGPAPWMLSCGAPGTLAWGSDSECPVQVMERTGASYTAASWQLGPIQFLFFDPAGNGWMMAQETAGVLPAAGADAHGQAMVSCRLPKGCTRITHPPMASEDGSLFVPMSGQTLRLHLEAGVAGKVLRADLIPDPLETQGALGVPNRPGTHLVYGLPGRPVLYLRKLGGDTCIPIETCAGGKPACLAPGAGADVWFVQTEPLGFGRIDTELARVVTFLPVPEGAGAALKLPWGMTFGPDQNLWITDREGCQIWRVTQEGAVSAIDLGKGNQPELIIPCADQKRVLFTQRGHGAVYGIWAVAARPEDRMGVWAAHGAGGSAAAVSMSEAETRAVEGKGTAPAKASGPIPSDQSARQQPRSWVDSPALAPRSVPRPLPPTPAAASLPAAQAVPDKPLPPPPVASGPGKPWPPPPPLPSGPSTGDVTVDPGAAPGFDGRVSPSSAPGPSRMVDKLIVEKRILSEILARNAAVGAEGGAVFAEALRSPQALARLLEKALRGARIGLPLSTDRAGLIYAKFTCPGVGEAHGKAVDTLLVVAGLRPAKAGDRYELVLVDAFPD